MHSGGALHLTPQNVAASALKAFEGKSKLVKVGEKWTKALSGDVDSVVFLKTLTFTDCKHLISTQIEKEKNKRFEVDKA
jgi:hypothetical protein